MRRADILRQVAPLIRDHLVVCNIGIPSQELHGIDDQASNFYMLGTMGLCSSIGLGLALVQPKPVIAIDGDGSVLTNLGTLPTIGNNGGGNLVLLVIDNGAYGSTGDQPTYTGGRTDLAGIARAAGCENVHDVAAAETGATLERALAAGGTHVIVARCDSGSEKHPPITMDPVAIRDRFMAVVKD